MKRIPRLFQFMHPTPLNSIKLRLPLSYAAIAFLVALSLGGVLMGILSQYYSQQETDYLRQNAQAIGISLGQILDSDVPPEDLQLQVNLFAFLSRTDLKLVDTSGHPIVESEVQTAFIDSKAANLQFFTSAVPDTVTIIQPVAVSLDSAAITDSSIASVTAIDPEAASSVEDHTIWVERAKNTGNMPSPLPENTVIYVNREPGLYGFGLTQADTTITTTVADRSAQIVTQPILDANGQTLATVYVSDGPAYGSEVLNSVAQGWLVASIFSITLAILVGYLASRNVSVPLEQLTQATNRMAAGNLSIRTDLRRSDEFGLLAQAFNDMASQVELTVCALQHFVSDAAHEVNTPITALRTNLELMNPHDLPEQDHVTLQRALGQVKRLEDLTRNLLKLSRLESGIQDAQPVVFDLVKIVRDVVASFASRADQANIDLAFGTKDESIPCLGYADHLRVALENLVDNALKFTPSGGQVDVTVQAQSGMTQIVIQDTGIGIPDEHLLSIFDRFHRAPNAFSFDGNGLGLAIVEEIVERHRGTITAHNMNPGTRMSIFLP